MMRQSRKYINDYRSYDSKWEKKLCEGVLNGVIYHPKKLGYIVEHNYTPDFLIEREGKAKIYIEAKGRFIDRAEASKYIWIRLSFTQKEQLVFLFWNPNKPMPHAKKRKDGTKQTHAEWAEKNGFAWFTEETIKEIL